MKGHVATTNVAAHTVAARTPAPGAGSVAGAVETRQGVAGSRLAECEAISGATDGAKLVDGLEDRQQVEIKAAQVEHGAPPILDVERLTLVRLERPEKHADLS